MLLKELADCDNLVIQGPPGTGKTFLMAELVAQLLNQNKSVFFTALPFGLSVASTSEGKQLSGTGMLMISDAAGRLPPRSRTEAQ